MFMTTIPPSLSWILYDSLIVWYKSVFVCVCADEQMYRCEDCDELFSSTLELRRHQKYSCSSTGSIFDTLRDDFKQEREDSDEPVHECKDCEKIFPNEYRCADACFLQRLQHTQSAYHVGYKCDYYSWLNALMSLCPPYQVWDNTW